jgi:UDP-N-acetylglucosamine 2-epimerase (non-hydrolysing)
VQTGLVGCSDIAAAPATAHPIKGCSERLTLTMVPADREGMTATVLHPVIDPGPAKPKVSILIVVGTRPEAIKLIPIILALRDSESFRPVVVTTGQHDLMVREVFKLAGIWADVTLWIGDTRSRLNERVASVMLRFEDFFHQWYHEVPDGKPTAEDVREGRYPAAVLVHGDTSSAFGAALAAFHLGVPVVHVEAGLRAGTGNMTPFPEELNRRLIARIACLHLAPTATNQENLVRENVPIKQIYVTGNSAIDALEWASGLNVPFVNPKVQEMFDSGRRLVLITAHRRESWGDGLQGIGEAIARLAATHPDVAFVLPLHPNPRVRSTLRPLLEKLPNVLLCEPVSYGEFARLLGRAHLVITDSGGIQEEAPALGKPVLVTRDVTERTEGVDAGTLALVGTDADRIVDVAGHLLTDRAAYTAMAEAPNPYGDGKAAERIVAALAYLHAGGAAPAPFGTSLDRRAVLAATGALTAGSVDVAAAEELTDPARAPVPLPVREAS